MRRRVLAVVALASFWFATPLPAQDVALTAPTAFPSVPLGEHVRVTVGGLRVEGTVAASDGTGLTLLLERGVTYRALRTDLERLEVARRRGWLAGAGRGALIGGLSIAAVTAATLPGQEKLPDGTCTDSFGAPQVCTTGRQVAEGLTMGALTGAVIGALFPGTRWERVESREVKVSVAPAAGGGVAVQTALSF